jgi:hypothetical protein
MKEGRYAATNPRLQLTGLRLTELLTISELRMRETAQQKVHMRASTKMRVMT